MVESEDLLKAINRYRHYTKGGLDMRFILIFSGAIILSVIDAFLVSMNIHRYIKTKKFSYLFYAALISFVFLAAVVR